MQQEHSDSFAAADSLARYIVDSASNATTTTDLSSVTHALDSVNSKRVVLKRTLVDDEFGDQELEFLTFIAERSPCEHVVRLLDSFEENNAADGSAGTPGRRRVLVLPALERVVMRQPDLWSVREYMWQLLAALETVHALGIVHLDITPANVMRDPHTGKYVLIDFGLARKVPPLPDPSDPESCNTLPEPHPVGRGTAGYIAPEMFSGTAYTTAPDLYSAGVICGQFLETFIPGFGLNYLGSKLIRPNVTSYIARKLLSKLNSTRRSVTNHIPIPFSDSRRSQSFTGLYSSSLPSHATPTQHHHRPLIPAHINLDATISSIATTSSTNSSAGGPQFLARSPSFIHHSHSYTNFATLHHAHNDDEDEPIQGIDPSNAKLHWHPAVRAAADLLCKMLDPDPWSRVCATDARAHPFFAMGREEFEGTEYAAWTNRTLWEDDPALGSTVSSVASEMLEDAPACSGILLGKSPEEAPVKRTTSSVLLSGMWGRQSSRDEVRIVYR
ncbi:kinase-like domain-containing protein [Cladochytrium replicatum]|nr:kinase-like domain-containing protein [Cladochytrium replicatum]